MREAFVRSIIYVRLPELAADERSFALLNKVREEHAADLGLADFKALVRDQFLMLHARRGRGGGGPAAAAGGRCGAGTAGVRDAQEPW